MTHRHVKGQLLRLAVGSAPFGVRSRELGECLKLAPRERRLQPLDLECSGRERPNAELPAPFKSHHGQALLQLWNTLPRVTRWGSACV